MLTQIANRFTRQRNNFFQRQTSRIQLLAYSVFRFARIRGHFQQFIDFRHNRINCSNFNPISIRIDLNMNGMRTG